MKTILHIITGLGDGGAEAVLYRLCTHSNGYRHIVVSLTNFGKYGPLLEAVGISVISLEMPRGRLTATGLWKIWRTIRHVQADVLQTWMYHADLLGGIVARLAGVRNICWGIHHTTLDPKHTSRSTISVAKVCAWLSHYVPRRIICCAEKSRFTHASLGYATEKMEVIPNGYDLSVFQPCLKSRASLRADLDIDNLTPVMGFVARYDPLKDHPNLLEALSKLRSQGIRPICLLVGTGMEKTNTVLTDMISAADLTDQIYLLGRRDDIPAIMNALDFHVLSSSSEAFPNVIAEAMACGTPCISTDVGDAALIIGETGMTVPPRNSNAMAGAIAEMLARLRREDWQETRAAARRQVSERFSLDKMVENYSRIWVE